MKKELIFSTLFFFIVFLFLLFYLDSINFLDSIKEDIHTILWASLIVIFLLFGIIAISVLFQYFSRQEKASVKPKKSKAL